MSNDRHDTLKYEYVKRRLYDSYVERTQRKIDKILHQLAVQESWIANLEDHFNAVEAELESLRLDKTSVRLPGRKEALERQS